MRTTADKSARFVELHAGKRCFLIPNPFDTGSARLLESLGFEALATTSAGFAFTRGKPDMGITREEKMLHLRELCAATSLPVNADLQDGFGARPEDAAETIRLAAQAGAVGGSIEDASGAEGNPTFDIGLATERVRAAAEAARSVGFKFMLTARAENLLYGRGDLAETIRRLQAFQEAGADVLYAPGPRTPSEIGAIVAAVAPKPVNILVSGNAGLTLADIAALGARRISVGSSLARAAWAGFIRAAELMAEDGSFAGFDGIVPFDDLNAFFRRDLKERSG
jgi:2-methylisocitrate lyase-like PEP mutase family enzyme